MRLVLAELPLVPDLSAALMGEQNSLGNALQTIIGYEQGNWGELSRQAKELGVKEEVLGDLYLRALQWGSEFSLQEKNPPAGAARDEVALRQ